MTEKSVFGLSPNGAAALSYVLGPITGIMTMVLERENKFVRFHALQSTLFILMLWIVWWGFSLLRLVLTSLPWFIGSLFGFLLGIVAFAAILAYLAIKLFLIWKAYKGATYKIPVFGQVAWAQVNK